MCDHCRSALARMDNETTAGHRVYEKAPDLARTWPGIAREREVRRNQSSGCCGGGCCERTKLISSGYGTKSEDDERRGKPRGEALDQSCLAAQPRNLCTHCNGYNFVGSSAGTPPCTPASPGFNSANCFADSINMPRGFVESYSQPAGVCPAIMRNLPCTSYREAKCTGGDCCDDESDGQGQSEERERHSRTA